MSQRDAFVHDSLLKGIRLTLARSSAAADSHLGRAGQSSHPAARPYLVPRPRRSRARSRSPPNGKTSLAPPTHDTSCVVESFVPRRQLRDRVVSIERVLSHGHTSHVLPSAGVVLGLQLSGRVLGPDGPLSCLGVTGVPDATRRYSYDGPTETFLVRFQPQGAACLGVPAHLLSGQSLSLDGLWEAPARAGAAALMDALLSTLDTFRRVALLEDFLVSLPFRRDMRVERALQRLSLPATADNGGLVAGTAHEVRLSQRQLERLFLERVGISPKRYAQLRRFERAVRLVRSHGPLAQVAIEAGYADQAHFIRDFRRLTGTTPRRFVQSTDFVL